MAIRLSRFEMPKKVVKDEKNATDTYTCFIAEPFEIGYARTIGNSLRRVLLSSIEGAAVSSVRIQGAEHEFCTLSGVKEDVTDIILNLKQVLVKAPKRDPFRMALKVKGPGIVKAGDFAPGGGAEILNPDLVLANLADDGKLEMEVEVRTGRGFCPAEANKGPDQEIGVIPVDTLYSPVTRVNFTTQNTRVGQRTDYDKLLLEIWTDGRVTPEEALKMSAAIIHHHMDVFVGLDEDIVEFEETETQADSAQDSLRKKLAMSVNEIELSVRAANCLNNANIKTVGELATKSEGDMLKYRNFGKKSLNEIKDKLVELGLTLGMSFDADIMEEIEAAATNKSTAEDK